MGNVWNALGRGINMRDWNNDGKIDGRDYMHDYMVYSEMTKESSSYNRSGSGVKGLGTGLLIFGVLIILLKIFGC